MKRFLCATAVAVAIAAPAYADGLDPARAGLGLRLPAAPNLAEMGGGQGVQFTAENNAGGHLVLTDKPCPVEAPEAKDFRTAFTYSAKGDVAFGCWTLTADRVVIVWLDDGGVAEYNPASFRKVDTDIVGERGA